ncbi:MAG: alpha/beta hydrolase, partial [Acidobacteriota bacterium]
LRRCILCVRLQVMLGVRQTVREPRREFLQPLSTTTREILMNTTARLLTTATGVLVFAVCAEAQSGKGGGDTLKKVIVGEGVELHYVERGTGVPVVFVAGGLADYSQWDGYVDAFAEHYHVLAYSRRYNFPNQNPVRSGHSSIVDADDLAEFIDRLHLGSAHVIGFSYGGLTALHLALRHPGAVRSLTLVEPPAASLLNGLPGDKAEAGKAAYADMVARQTSPLRAAFRSGDRERGMRIFHWYLSGDSTFWDSKFPEPLKDATRRNYKEWDALLTNGELLSPVDAQGIRDLPMPVLILSGEKTGGFPRLIDDELDRLLKPHGGQHVVIPNADHGMLFQQPALCRAAILTFLGGK